MALNSDPDSSRRTGLLIARVLLWLFWAGMLVGVISFVFVEAIIFSQASSSMPPNPDGVRLLFKADLILGAISLPVAYAIRFFLVRAGERRKTFSGLLAAYVVGKLLGWMAVESMIMFSLVVSIIAQGFMPTAPIAAVGWVLLLADMPLFLPFWRGRARGRGV